jgi:type IV pilus assembly protein PilB
VSNTRLLEYLQQKGKIDQIQADKVKVMLANGSKSEEALILEAKYVDKEEIAQAKGDLFNFPYVNLREQKIDDSVFNLVSAARLKKFRAVPFAKAGHIVKVAMVDPFDIQAIQAIQQSIKQEGRVLAHIASEESIRFILDRNAGSFISTEVSEALSNVESDVKKIDLNDAESLDDADIKNAPVAKIVNSIMKYAVKTETSDIHIEPQEKQIRVRFRIHGVMIEKLILPISLHSALTARIKIISDMKIDEKRIPQDDRFQIDVEDHVLDVRVSTMPSIYGEKTVMRLLDSTGGVAKLETTGMRGSAYKAYTDVIKATNGIVLITGPTGSGKTFTLAGTLDRLNDPKVNIITLENPVEIRIPGVTQVQINPAVGLTFAVALRSVLRQDPDVVMVGEIRDEETAQLAVEASLTGHLVLATLHTNGAAAAIPRLVDMGIPSYLLASTLKVSVAQRLPRRLCSKCKKPVIVDAEKLAHISETLRDINGFDVVQYVTQYSQSEEGKKNSTKVPSVNANGEKTIELFEEVGCDSCGGTGFKGRIGIFEVMPVSDKVRDIMTKNIPEAEIDAIARGEGMVTMIQDGYIKALEGITTLEEVLRVSRE